ncbi:MAG: hypothetical protein M1827_002571 [Pycnora praestabilis]|nr:MAG: hypothetical protein M1827_002571 [Pycnora praestabilis]
MADNLVDCHGSGGHNLSRLYVWVQQDGGEWLGSIFGDPRREARYRGKGEGLDHRIDDPLIWGSLPFRYHFSPENHRWTLASYDICFTNKYDRLPNPFVETANFSPLPRATSAFFTFGQVLPTHRHLHSPYGGAFQPTLTQAIRLLSRAPFTHSPHPSTAPSHSLSSPDMTDPFSSPHLTYSTNGTDTFPAPSAYLSRRHSWVHIFPEGFIHQRPDRTMRYFKWGVARLILESDPIPDVVPMWIEGTDQIMHEARKWPRFVPRVGKDVSVTFGAKVDTESVFGDLRRRWQGLQRKEEEVMTAGGGLEVGILTEELKYGKEAVDLRIECTKRVREEVLKLRRSRGWSDEDPKAGLVETRMEEGAKREGKMEDGSWVKDT